MPKENNHTRQYFRSSVICLCSWNCNDFTIHRKKIQDVVVLFCSNSSRVQILYPTKYAPLYVPLIKRCHAATYFFLKLTEKPNVNASSHLPLPTLAFPTCSPRLKELNCSI